MNSYFMGFQRLSKKIWKVSKNLGRSGSTLATSCLRLIASTHHHHQINHTGHHHHHHHHQTPNLSPISAAELQSEFAPHGPSIARINNGSFGSCPGSIISAQQKHQLKFLQQPDDFYFNHLKPSLLHTRHVIKTLINATSIDQISLLDNVTTAASIVLHHTASSFSSGHFSPGDIALILNFTYPAVKNAVAAYFSRSGGRVIEVQLPFPITSDSEIISQFQQTLEKAKSKGHRIRLAILDHITSMPSFVIPIKQLVNICKNSGVDHVFVDAAHAIGSTKVDMKEIGADFYTSNLHKWFFCPPSVAFLYCNDPSKFNIHHLVISHEYGNGLPIESMWIGTRDYSAQIVVPEVVDFVSRFEGGIEGIVERNHEKVVEMGMMLGREWGTRMGVVPEMCASMAMVGLPESLGIGSDGDVLKLRKYLRECFGVEVHIYYRAPKDGEVRAVTGYARISHHVYNKSEDYYRFRDAINKLVSDGFTCDVLSD